MKTVKIISIAALSMFLCTAYAQESDVDTTKNPIRQTDPSPRQTPEEMQNNDLRDMIRITPKDIPPSMENALKGDDYSGESKTFYRSNSGDSYLVEIRDGNITHTYRFDAEGKPVNKKN
jgi:hypothetical protein